MGEYKYFLDTNIFLRFLIQDEISKVAECQKLFEFMESGEIKAITSSLVLAELTWTGLSFYKIKKNAMVDILRGLIKMRGLKIVDDCDFFQAIFLYEENNIKFVDALIASHKFIQNHGMPVISYDKDFNKIGIKRLEPKDLI